MAPPVRRRQRCPPRFLVRPGPASNEADVRRADDSGRLHHRLELGPAGEGAQRINGLGLQVFLVIPPDHRETVRVRLVMDAVQALFARERAVLEGS